MNEEQKHNVCPYSFIELDSDMLDDELDDFMDENFKVFFQFGENEPIEMATVENGHTFSITLDGSTVDNPTVVFADGNGNSFKLFMKKCS